MSEQFEIRAAVRADVGKGASRRLRRQGEYVPGIIYGGEGDPINLTINSNELVKAMQNEAFFSQILNVVVDDKSHQAVLRDVQRNPATNKVIHLDFYRISANKPIQVTVPLHFVNEDRCKGVREGGGNVTHAMTDLEISCLPKHLPAFIEVYMAELDLNQTIHLSDIALPEGVNVVALDHGDDRNVVSVLPPRGGADEDEDADVAVEAGDEEAAGDDAGEEPSKD